MTGKATHGHTRGQAGTKRISPTYLTWLAMRSRCFNPKNEKYPMYGARGVTVCERWATSFENFLADMGERPKGTTLDRKDNAKGYEPGNCKWSTPKEQALNSDTYAKGWRRNNTHCPQGHEFTTDNTRVKDNYRKCRTCDRERAQRNRDRKKMQLPAN